MRGTYDLGSSSAASSVLNPSRLARGHLRQGVAEGRLELVAVGGLAVVDVLAGHDVQGLPQQIGPGLRPSELHLDLTEPAERAGVVEEP